MKLINQSFKIIEMTKNPLELVERAGRTCYQSGEIQGCTLEKAPADISYCPEGLKYPTISGTRVDCNPECINHSSNKFARMLIMSRHYSVLEHASVTVLKSLQQL